MEADGNVSGTGDCGARGKPTFVLGVGCQKGGTSWLATYLREHPNVNLGFAKEYHIFDAIYADLTGFYKETLTRAMEILKTEELGSGRGTGNLKKLEFYHRPESYFDYFEYLTLKNRDTVAVGDLTPSYALLPIEGFQYIRDELRKRNFNVRVIFLMRDPVDRVVSMARQRRRTLEDDTQQRKTLTEAVRDVYASAPQRRRTKYETTLSNLYSVFSEQELFVSFYEHLFTFEEIKRITQFLGVPYKPPKLNAKVNPSFEPSEIDEDLRTEIAQFYASTYEYVANRYGADTVRSTWPNYWRIVKS